LPYTSHQRLARRLKQTQLYKLHEKFAVMPALTEEDGLEGAQKHEEAIQATQKKLEDDKVNLESTAPAKPVESITPVETTSKKSDPTKLDNFRKTIAPGVNSVAGNAFTR